MLVGIVLLNDPIVVDHGMVLFIIPHVVVFIGAVLLNDPDVVDPKILLFIMPHVVVFIDMVLFIGAVLLNDPIVVDQNMLLFIMPHVVVFAGMLPLNVPIVDVITDMLLFVGRSVTALGPETIIENGPVTCSAKVVTTRMY